MTKENKELLLKDLLGRVLYGVKVDYHGDIFTLGYNLYLNKGDVAFENYPMLYSLEGIESVKPYLRPMSNMTEKEKIIYQSKQTIIFDFKNNKLYVDNYYSLDWLNEHHFDYRGLIEKGLALPVTKEEENEEISTI